MQAAAIHPLPPQGDCRLWRIELDLAPPDAALAALAEPEWERARRFVFTRDRRRYLAAHAALRGLLGSCLGVPPAQLDFQVGAFGKPALSGVPPLPFNLSHSQGVALVAVGRPGTEVGVDVESLRPMPDALDLARAYFSAAECAALEAMAEPARDAAFLRCWTRKEACLKALGAGLTLDTRRFETGLAGDCREVRIRHGDADAWVQVESIALPDGEIGALARLHAAPATVAPQRPARAALSPCA